MPLEHLFFIYAVFAAAYLVRGITGFGSALVAVPILTILLPVSFTVPVICVSDLLASIIHGFGNRRHIQWSTIFRLLPATLAGIGAGIIMLKKIDPGVLAQGLGFFVAGYGFYSLFAMTPTERGNWWAAPAGFFGGSVGAVFGTGGPFYVMFLQLKGYDKQVFRATIATIFIADGIFRLIGFAAGGLYDRQKVLIILGILPVMVAGLFLGGLIHRRISRKNFNRVISVCLIVSGLALLIKYG